MSFHKKAFIAFAIFHAIFTLGGLVAGSLQAYPAPSNDQDLIIQGVWPYIWVIFCVALSLMIIALAYFVRTIIKVSSRMRQEHPESLK